MDLYEIKTITGHTIYHGKFKNFSSCVERAIEEKIDLSYANLRYANLQNINMDGLTMTNIDFTGTNLHGANLSECALFQCCFDNADLTATEYSQSEIKNSSFLNSQFGNTNINHSQIIKSLFGGETCLDLNFINAKIISKCIYIDCDGHPNIFSAPPIVIKGLRKTPIIGNINMLMSCAAQFIE